MKEYYKGSYEKLIRAQSLIHDLPWYKDCVNGYIKFMDGDFRTLKDQRSPQEALQDHYFEIQNNRIYQFLRKHKILP